MLSTVSVPPWDQGIRKWIFRSSARSMQHRTMLFNVPQIPSVPHSNGLGIFFLQHQTGEVIIALQLIPKTVLLVINVLFLCVILQDFYIRTYVTGSRLPHSVISFYQIFLPLFLPLWGVIDKVNTLEIISWDTVIKLRKTIAPQWFWRILLMPYGG